MRRLWTCQYLYCCTTCDSQEGQVEEPMSTIGDSEASDSWPWPRNVAVRSENAQAPREAPTSMSRPSRTGIGAPALPGSGNPASHDFDKESTRARIENLIRTFAYEVCGDGVVVTAYSAATKGKVEQFRKSDALNQDGRLMLLQMDKRLTQLELVEPEVAKLAMSTPRQHKQEEPEEPTALDSNHLAASPSPTRCLASTDGEEQSAVVANEDNGSSTVSTSPTPVKPSLRSMRAPPLLTLPLRCVTSIEKEQTGNMFVIWIAHALGPESDLGLSFANALKRDQAFICLRVFQKSLPTVDSEAMSSTTQFTQESSPDSRAPPGWTMLNV